MVAKQESSIRYGAVAGIFGRTSIFLYSRWTRTPRGGREAFSRYFSPSFGGKTRKARGSAKRLRSDERARHHFPFAKKRNVREPSAKTKLYGGQVGHTLTHTLNTEAGGPGRRGTAHIPHTCTRPHQQVGGREARTCHEIPQDGVFEEYRVRLLSKICRLAMDA